MKQCLNCRNQIADYPSTQFCQNCGSPLRQPSGAGFKLVVIGGIIVVSVFLGFGYISKVVSQNSRNSMQVDVFPASPMRAEKATSDLTRLEREAAVQHPEKQVELERPIPWETGGFGNVMTMKPVIVNKNAFAVKDIYIHCKVYAPSGTELGDNYATVFEVIPAKSKIRPKEINLGFINSQSKKAGCVVEAVSTED